MVEVTSGCAKGDSRAAIADLGQAIALKATDPLGYFWRGVAFKNLGDAGRAIADFDWALQLNPDLLDAQHTEAFAAFIRVITPARSQISMPRFPAIATTRSPITGVAPRT